MDRKTFGIALRKGRMAKKLTQTQLAEKAGFTMRAVQYWEHGTKNITLENAAKLLDALGMEITIQDKPA